MNSLDVILKRKRAYKKLFLADDGTLNEDGRIVLADLANFCRANKSTTHVANGKADPILSAVGDGRREVWLRLQEMLYLDEKLITKLKEERHHE